MSRNFSPRAFFITPAAVGASAAKVASIAARNPSRHSNPDRTSVCGSITMRNLISIRTALAWAAFAGFLSCFSTSANAATFVWDGGGADGNFSTANNWNPNTAPGTINANDFQFGALVSPFQSAANVDLTGNPGPFTFNAALASPMTISGNFLQFGAATTGPVIVNNSTSLQTINNVLRMFNNITFTAAAGNLQLGGATLDLRNDLAGVGARALTLNGANNGTIAGNIVVVNGTASQYSLIKQGSGTWTLSGTNQYGGTTTVSAGTLNLGGGNSAAPSGAITVGSTGNTGVILNITGGTYTMGGNAVFAGLSATSGQTGTINQTAGTVNITSFGGLGVLVGNSAGTGTYNLSAGSIVNAGASTNTRGVMLGVNTNATGTFNLSGTGTLNLTNAALMVGRSDDGSVTGTTVAYNQTGGTATVETLTIGGRTGGSAGVNATFTVTGGTFTASSFGIGVDGTTAGLSRGNTNTSTINIGGTADVTLPAFPTLRGTGSTATINFDGGTLRNAAASTTYMQGLSNAFIEDGGAKFNTGLGSITINQNLLTHGSSLGGGLTKEGANALTLTGTNTYTGTTTVSGGSLILSHGSGNNIASSATVELLAGTTLNVTGLSGGTFTLGSSVNQILKGSGTLTGSLSVASGSTVEPGNSAGTLSISNALSLVSGSLLAYELNAGNQTVGGGINDLITIGGNLTLDGTLNVSSSPLSAGTWRLMNYVGSLTDNTLAVGAINLAPLHNAAITAGGGEVNLVVTLVPEPSSLAMLAFGMISLWLFRKHR